MFQTLKPPSEPIASAPKRWRPDEHVGKLHLFLNISSRPAKRYVGQAQVMAETPVAEQVHVISAPNQPAEIFADVMIFSDTLGSQLPIGGSTFGVLQMGYKHHPKAKPWEVRPPTQQEHQHVEQYLAGAGYVTDQTGRIVQSEITQSGDAQQPQQQPQGDTWGQQQPQDDTWNSQQPQDQTWVPDQQADQQPQGFPQ